MSRPMMILQRLFALAAFLVLGCGLGNAQLLTPVATPQISTGGGSFQGVGDVQSGWDVWYGVIPYSAAYASSGGKAFAFSCNAGAITGDVVFQASGALVLTPLASCVGTISITTLYVQTGTTSCTGTACDLNVISSGTIVFLQSGCPSTAVVTYCISSSGLVIAATNPITVNQPFTEVAILDRPTSARGAYRAAFVCPTYQMGAGQTDDTAYMFAGGSLPTTPMTDGVTHTYFAVADDAGTGSTGKVDTASPVTMTLGNAAACSGVCNIGGGGSVWTGFIYGVGQHNTHLSSGTQTAIAHNMCLNSGSSAYPTC